MAAQIKEFASRVVGGNKSPTSPTTSSSDPFAAQRTADNNPFAERRASASSSNAADPSSSPTLGSPGSPTSPSAPRDRRMSKEWDASKVPPSRFQKREGSLYATPGSRDGHVGRNRDGLDKYTEKLKQKGWA